MVLSTKYYTCFAFNTQNSDLALLERDIHTHLGYKKKENTAVKENTAMSDFRFNENITYQGIGNSSFMRVNACAALHLQLWCLQPSDSTAKKITQYFANIIVKPFALVFDLVANLALAVMKMALLTIVLVGKVIQKCGGAADVQFFDTLDYGVKNLSHHGNHTFSAFVNFATSGMTALFLSVTAGSIVILSSTIVPSFLTYFASAYVISNLLGPKYDLFFRTFEFYHWSYKANEKTCILDQGRVKYLRETCGWTHVRDETLKDTSPAWIQEVSVNYGFTEEKFYVSARWLLFKKG